MLNETNGQEAIKMSDIQTGYKGLMALTNESFEVNNTVYKRKPTYKRQGPKRTIASMNTSYGQKSCRDSTRGKRHNAKSQIERNRSTEQSSILRQGTTYANAFEI